MNENEVIRISEIQPKNISAADCKREFCDKINKIMSTLLLHTLMTKGKNI